MADPDLYRTKEEIEHWKERDPIGLFTRFLRDAALLADADLEGIEASVAAAIDAAVAAAEAGPWEPVDDLLLDVTTP
jgi:TPP-dependent pyruvate/acetoin dehydrogenase alpha subunit